MPNNLLIFVGCVPALVLLGAVLFERRRRKQTGERPPQQEKLLRPAGHSLSQKLAELGDQSLIWVMGGYIASIAAVGFISPSTQARPADMIVTPVIFGLLAAVSTVAAYRKLRTMRVMRLGLLGEQSVAEQLQHLVAIGFHVFHDIPGDGPWNVDHVVVGAGGLFAIETKARTKKPGRKGQPAHEAVFDGEAIIFPHYRETDALDQARDNARWLANWLTKATGSRVSATAIVALPGWWVVPKINPQLADVKVLSGKQVVSFIADGTSKLSDEAVRQISYQLDQRCRDVEF